MIYRPTPSLHVLNVNLDVMELLHVAVAAQGEMGISMTLCGKSVENHLDVERCPAAQVILC